MTPRNIFLKITNESLGWLSAAEGFVFLSGLTAGLVYTYKYLEKGEKTITTASRTRAWLIYKYHMLLFLLVALAVFSTGFLQEYWSVDYASMLKSPVATTLLATVLLYQPNFLDILPMYAVFVLFIPIIIRYFERGAYAPVLLVSGALYLLGTFNAFALLTPIFHNLSEHINTGFFNLLCWQFIFVIGLYLGSLYYHGKTDSLQRNSYLFYAAVVLAAPLFIAKFLYIPLGNFDIQYWSDKTYLRPLRLLNFFAILIIITYIATKFKTWFHYKPICTLGKYSLEVFTFHIMLLILLKPLEEYLNGLYEIRVSNNFSVYPLGTLLIVAVLLALFLVPIVKAKRNTNTPPAVKKAV